MTEEKTLFYLDCADLIRMVLKKTKTRKIVRQLGLDRMLYRRSMIAFTKPSHLQQLPEKLLQDLHRRPISDGRAAEAIRNQFIQYMLSFDYGDSDYMEPLTESPQRVSKNRYVDEAQPKDPILEDTERLLRKVLDLRMPHEVYPKARGIKRKIKLHMGPTNSGKTYHAIQSLKMAESGIYCGPLRLLAWEIYDKLEKAGVPCNLITGQERIESRGATHTSCTVETANLKRNYDVAVIDEIQMSGNFDRGDAFTRAFLGLPAKELHVCGDVSTAELITELCSITGDELEVVNYDRLGSLKLSRPLQSIHELQKGDCVVVFSRKKIHAFKKHIETTTGLRACVVYGSLPPETRKQQAILFNEPDSGYDILIASDAIGMGLNLAIDRIIFSSIDKFDGEAVRKLSVSEILQIAGRAGRFKGAYATGYVSLLSNKRSDYRYLLSALQKSPPMLEQAGLRPSLDTIQRLQEELPEANFVELLLIAENYATVDGTYFLCKMQDMKDIAGLIKDTDLSLEDMYTFCCAPAQIDFEIVAKTLKRYAKQFSDGESVYIDVRYEGESPVSSSALLSLEKKHKVLDLYLWLAMRYPNQFPEKKKAREELDLICTAISESLEASCMVNTNSVLF